MELERYGQEWFRTAFLDEALPSVKTFEHRHPIDVLVLTRMRAIFSATSGGTGAGNTSPFGMSETS